MSASFEFSCHRCGHCCSVATGYVWIEEGEIPGLAAAMSMSESAFAAQYVRRIGDRLSLTEKEGRCALLESPNHCTVYTARPKHCREFPYWPQILEGGEALERAREYCPGIQVFPDRVVAQRAFVLLESLYQRLEQELRARNPICIARGVCCEFEKVDHALYASLLETDYAIVHGEGEAEEKSGRCVYHRNGLCENRLGRPLGCRTYFCDPTFQPEVEELYNRYYKEIQLIARQTGYPWGYASFVELVKSRKARVEKDLK